MKTTTKKEFECVKTVRKERERIATETKGKTHKEIVAYFKARKKKVQAKNV